MILGDIYLATDELTGKHFAAKVERINSKFPQLQQEYKIYKKMKKFNGFPRVYWYGECSIITKITHKIQSCYVMIMDKLGESLEFIYQKHLKTGRKCFSLKTVFMIGIQIVNRIQKLHQIGYLHRDVKPDNFLIGNDIINKKKNSVIHMIDMGLSKIFLNENGDHIINKNGKQLTGTPRYASINTHNGLEQSRRDDLESLVYVLIYFLKGRLPWQGIKGKNKYEKYELIRKKNVLFQ